MRAHKQYVTIQNPKSLVLTDLPFHTGQRVEIVMIADDPVVECADLQALLRETQCLPTARAISMEEIDAEIAAYRAPS